MAHEIRQKLTVISASGDAALILAKRNPPDLKQIGECLAEIVHLRINGERVQSIALESATPAPVHRLLAELGLDHFENSSYPSILKQILDFDH